MTDQLAPGNEWLPLIAENARHLAKDGGQCEACGKLLGRGRRVADLPDGGLIHVSCTAAWTTRQH
jgi:hypothetical protein